MDGTKQFTDIKAMYDEIERQIDSATNCKKLEEAAVALTFGSMAVGLSDKKYAPEERMTANEKEIIKERGKKLTETAKAKADQLGCEKKEYSL